MLSITDISVRIAGRLLIDHSSAQIVPGARVGFVGRNGVGKSTLFSAIRGELPTETGTITIPPRWRVGSLAQEAPDGPESLVNIVLKADVERDALLREAETAHDPHRIAEIQTRLVDIDAHSAPARAAAILNGLGFSTADQALPCQEFSGGWRMRVALAATLFAAPDLLLLDEPTNYLDLEGTLWLEDHLANYAHRHRHQPRPRPARHLGRPDPAPRSRQADALQGDLLLVRGTTRHARNARRQARQASGRRAQAAAGLCRSLQGQGVESPPGAVPRQDAGKDEAGHRAGDAGRARDFISGA